MQGGDRSGRKTGFLCDGNKLARFYAAIIYSLVLYFKPGGHGTMVEQSAHDPSSRV